MLRDYPIPTWPILFLIALGAILDGYIIPGILVSIAAVIDAAEYAGLFARLPARTRDKALLVADIAILALIASGTYLMAVAAVSQLKSMQPLYNPGFSITAR